MRKYRIFLTLGGRATPGDNNNIWVKNLYDPLTALGHDIHLFNIDDYAAIHGLGYMSLAAKERLSAELEGIFLREHKRKPFDVFFSYLHNGQIVPDVLRQIKKHCYTINYSTNYHQFEMYKEVASIVDYNIYISKVAKVGFDGLGVKSYWMPLAANPEFYKPSNQKNGAVIFVGSAYGHRPYLFWRLLQYGINLEVHGHGWKPTGSHRQVNVRTIAKKFFERLSGYELKKLQKLTLEDQISRHYNALSASILCVLRRDYADHFFDSLSDDEYVKTIAEAGIVINIQESRFNHDYLNHNVLFGSNLRDFETTMSKTFLCTQYSLEIEELFDVGKEIVCYHNEHDLVDKIRYYNQHATKRNAIAEAGYRRSLTTHTWKKRFLDFFSDIKI